MKNIISLVACLTLMVGTALSQGTSRINQKMPNQKLVNGVVVNISVSDTTHDADTSYTWFGSMLGYSCGVQTAVKNVTGTTGATITYWGSNDNTNWYQVMTDTLQCNSCLATVTITGLTSAASPVVRRPATYPGR